MYQKHNIQLDHTNHFSYSIYTIYQFIHHYTKYGDD